LTDIRLYPNPVSHHFWVDGLPSSGVLKLYNAQGVLVQNQQIRSSKEKVEVNSLIPGFYFFQVHSPDGIYFSKVAVY